MLRLGLAPQVTVGGQLPSSATHRLLSLGLKSALVATIDFPGKPKTGTQARHGDGWACVEKKHSCTKETTTLKTTDPDTLARRSTTASCAGTGLSKSRTQRRIPVPWAGG